MRKDILIIYFENEQIHLNKEQNSNLLCCERSKSKRKLWTFFSFDLENFEHKNRHGCVKSSDQHVKKDMATYLLVISQSNNAP